MTIKKEKGFTIIELLVVIAIIAVLAAIVLVNVTQYINKGKNAAIKGNMATVLTNMAVYNDTTQSYSGFCGATNFTVPQTAITNAGGTATCNVAASNSAVCACTTLNVTSADPTGSTFCVDYTGAKKETTTACATECPVAGVCQ